jgi:hypothetical protein
MRNKSFPTATFFLATIGALLLLSSLFTSSPASADLAKQVTITPTVFIYLPYVAKDWSLPAPTPTDTPTPGGPRPGRWEGQGRFSGSFRVESDRARMTNFEGSFWTSLCGRLDVPGDLTPPAEIEISDDKFHLVLSEPDTTTFLRIDGTFNTETSVEGDYSWGVDGCGFGGRIDWSASWQGD